jgi:hypothetical protein
MVLSASGTISRNSFLRIVRFMAIALCWTIVSSPLRFDTGRMKSMVAKGEIQRKGRVLKAAMARVQDGRPSLDFARYDGVFHTA